MITIQVYYRCLVYNVYSLFHFLILYFSLLTEIMDFSYFPGFGGLAWFVEPFHRPTLRSTDTQTHTDARLIRQRALELTDKRTEDSVLDAWTLDIGVELD